MGTTSKSQTSKALAETIPDDQASIEWMANWLIHKMVYGDPREVSIWLILAHMPILCRKSQSNLAADESRICPNDSVFLQKKTRFRSILRLRRLDSHLWATH